MSKKTELFWDGLGADTLARKKTTRQQKNHTTEPYFALG